MNLSIKYLQLWIASVSGIPCASNSKLVKSMQAQLWSVNFTSNFWRFFLLFGPNVLRRAAAASALGSAYSTVQRSKYGKAVEGRCWGRGCCERISGGSTARARDGDKWCTEQGRAAPAPIISPSVTDSVSLKMPFWARFYYIYQWPHFQIRIWPRRNLLLQKS